MEIYRQFVFDRLYSPEQNGKLLVFPLFPGELFQTTRFIGQIARAMHHLVVHRKETSQRIDSTPLTVCSVDSSRRVEMSGQLNHSKGSQFVVMSGLFRSLELSRHGHEEKQTL